MSLFHVRFKELREESGKTQVQIAKDLGIKQQTFSNYCNDREPNYKMLITIANYFSVSTDYLLGVSDCKKPENTDFCRKTGLSEAAIEVLSGSSGIYGKAAGVANGKWLNAIITESREYYDIQRTFQELTNMEHIRDLANRLLTDEERKCENEDYDLYCAFRRNHIAFAISALESQLSRQISKIAREKRFETNEGILSEVMGY